MERRHHKVFNKDCDLNNEKAWKDLSKPKLLCTCTTEREECTHRYHPSQLCLCPEKADEESWEVEFDREFVATDGRFLTGTLTVGKAKDFIRTKKSAWQQEARQDYEEVHEDHKRLVRELDLLMWGPEGAAIQASLCDLVGCFPRWIRGHDGRITEKANHDMKDKVLNLIEKHNEKQLDGLDKSDNPTQIRTYIAKGLKRYKSELIELIQELP